jgi:hypothetical protein
VQYQSVEKLAICRSSLTNIQKKFRLRTDLKSKSQFADLKKLVETLEHDQKLKSKVTCVPYEQAMATHMPTADFVLNCQPMDNGAADAKMIELAKARTNPTAVLVHLKGVPVQRNHTSPAWQDAAADRVFFLEDLQRQDQLDRVHNQRMRELAERAIHNCVTSRSLGMRPVENRLLIPEAEYAEFVGQKKPPAFPSSRRPVAPKPKHTDQANREGDGMPPLPG